MAARLTRRVVRNKVPKKPAGKVQQLDLQKIVVRGAIPAQLLREITSKGTVRVRGIGGSKAEFLRSKDGVTITAEFTIGGRRIAKRFKASTGLAVTG